MQIKKVLLVVAKRPAPGRTKTRLTPPLTPEQAAALYECFLQDTLAIMRQVPGHVPGVEPVIAYYPPKKVVILPSLRQILPKLCRRATTWASGWTMR